MFDGDIRCLYIMKQMKELLSEHIQKKNNRNVTGNENFSLKTRFLEFTVLFLLVTYQHMVFIKTLKGLFYLIARKDLQYERMKYNVLKVALSNRTFVDRIEKWRVYLRK